jgi:CheY-like chemotaxis protein
MIGLVEWRPVRTVLVADDDPHINQLLSLRLAARGLSVRSAADGQEALEMIEAELPDLLVLDVSMPRKGGLEVLHWVRNERLDCGVIMATAFGSEDVATAALREGADDYLRKPFEPKELEAVVSRTIKRLELDRQNSALREALDRQREQLELEIARAARVQQDLLPRSMPDIAGYRMAAVCTPAREVGGDFFDWTMRDDGRLAITVADVMGKGMPAALLMATVRAALRAIVPTADPAGVVAAVNQALADDLDRSASLITLFHAHLDVSSGQIDFVDAGHGHAFLRRADGASAELGTGNVPIGFDAGAHYEARSLVLAAGDTLVVFSDGLIDAIGGAEGPLDVAALLVGPADAVGTVDHLQRAAYGQPGGLSDDLTIVAVQRDFAS